MKDYLEYLPEYME